MFTLKVKPSYSDTMEEIEELENLLFENAFNATTFTHELSTGAQCWVTGSERIEGYILFREENGLIDILRVAVHPTYQSRGVGTSLMKIAMKQSERCMLSVRKDNDGAIRLYRRLGFSILGDLGSSWVMTTSAAS